LAAVSGRLALYFSVGKVQVRPGKGVFQQAPRPNPAVVSPMFVEGSYDQCLDIIAEFGLPSGKAI
jgi:hypothetical protein